MQYELILLEKLVKAGADSYVEGPDTFIITTLELLFFVATDWHYFGKGKMRYMICDELREAVAPHLSRYLTSEKQATQFMVEQCAYRVVNLYGFLFYEKLLEQLHEHHNIRSKKKFTKEGSALPVKKIVLLLSCSNCLLVSLYSSMFQLLEIQW